MNRFGSQRQSRKELQVAQARTFKRFLVVVRLDDNRLEALSGHAVRDQVFPRNEWHAELSKSHAFMSHLTMTSTCTIFGYARNEL